MFRKKKSYTQIFLSVFHDFWESRNLVVIRQLKVIVIKISCLLEKKKKIIILIHLQAHYFQLSHIFLWIFCDMFQWKNGKNMQ